MEYGERFGAGLLIPFLIAKDNKHLKLAFSLYLPFK
jgi:hypothetical protein